MQIPECYPDGDCRRISVRRKKLPSVTTSLAFPNVVIPNARYIRLKLATPLDSGVPERASGQSMQHSWTLPPCSLVLACCQPGRPADYGVVINALSRSLALDVAATEVLRRELAGKKA